MSKVHLCLLNKWCEPFILLATKWLANYHLALFTGSLSCLASMLAISSPATVDDHLSQRVVTSIPYFVKMCRCGKWKLMMASDYWQMMSYKFLSKHCCRSGLTCPTQLPKASASIDTHFHKPSNHLTDNLSFQTMSLWDPPTPHPPISSQ